MAEDDRLLFAHDISLRTINALERAGITTLSQVAPMTRRELMEIKGLGRKGTYEVSRTVGRMADIALAEQHSGRMAT